MINDANEKSMILSVQTGGKCDIAKKVRQGIPGEEAIFKSEK